MTVAGAAEPSVGFVGLGPMGMPMAGSLADAGFDLTVWNRTAGKAHDLAHDIPTVRVAHRPADAAADIVIAMLHDLPQIRDVVHRPDGLLSGWAGRPADAPEPVLVVTSTVSPVEVREWAGELAEQGIRLVDAPVSGGPLGAQERRLSIMVGAADDDFATVEAVLSVMGKTVRHLGPVGSGELAKSCNQIIVGATLSGLSEALRLAQAGGLDLADVLDVLDGGLAGSEALRQKRRHWLSGDYSGGGSVDNQLKDLGFGLAAAQDLGVSLPVTEITEQLYRQLSDRGDGDLDHSAVFRLP